MGDEMQLRTVNLMGCPVRVFSSTHERSHIAMAVGMAPRNEAEMHAVLVWEGFIGAFYLLDRNWAVTRRIPVLDRPGHRFAFLYGLADPTFPADAPHPRGEDAGKLMALAAYGDPPPPIARSPRPSSGSSTPRP
jgi:hydroxymethyl cephem carbamoyltransferase